MLQSYLPILLVIAFVIANAVLMLGVSRVSDLALKTARPTAVKVAPYESGMPVLGDARARFSVTFYMVTLLFIVFDIEAVFMIPWAVAFQQLTAMRGLLLVEMLVFMLILVVGFIYVWKRGALEWE
ncbi:MAG TPA: NADH-quinone oxidoreductase subunit A [Gemmatimonadales bacterium]|nr:NADH-quinone oxidoreductase subunit A [Gemmatimonadales bacterium]